MTTASVAVPAGTSHPIYRAPTARSAVTVLVLIGVALRLWAYLAETGLYLDEILLSYSILNVPLLDLLTRPLPLDQVAPLGFLLVERAAVTIFGHKELALRLFPFVCSKILPPLGSSPRTSACKLALLAVLISPLLN
jgi:hypothetical protein